MGEGKKKKRDKPKGKERSPGRHAPLPCELAYERGDYASAGRLAREAVSGDDGKRAREVLDRVKVDFFPLLVFAACLLFFSTVAFCGLGG